MPTPISLVPALLTALIKVLLYLLASAAKPVSKLKLDACVGVSIAEKKAIIINNYRNFIRIRRSLLYFFYF